MLEGQFAGLLGRVGLFHRLADDLCVVSLADHLIKAAIGTAAAHRRQMTIMTAIVEDRLKRVAGKALKLDICPGEESAALRGSPCYREESIELRIDVVPDLIDFGAVRESLSQVGCEITRLFRHIIGRKLMIHTATGD